MSIIEYYHGPMDGTTVEHSDPPPLIVKVEVGKTLVRPLRGYHIYTRHGDLNKKGNYIYQYIGVRDV